MQQCFYCGVNKNTKSVCLIQPAPKKVDELLVDPHLLWQLMFSFSYSASPTVGDHGYYNSLPSMHPFMAATGPSFHVGVRISSLHSVDLYPLMCHLLAIPPRPHNGSIEASQCLLVDEVCDRRSQVTTLVLGIFFLLALVGIGESRPRLKSFVCFERLLNGVPFLFSSLPAAEGTQAVGHPSLPDLADTRLGQRSANHVKQPGVFRR